MKPRRPKPTWLDWAMVIVSIIAVYLLIGTVAGMGDMMPADP